MFSRRRVLAAAGGVAVLTATGLGHVAQTRRALPQQN
jgi:hypothetical protein